MKEWKEIKISDLGTVITGNTPPRKNPELYGNHTIFIKPTDITEDEKYTPYPEEYYSEIGHKKYIKSLIPKGSTCVVTIGSIGKKITKAHRDCFINQAMNAVIPFSKYDEEFVFYLLKYNLSQLKTLDSGTASGRENVSKSSFSNIKVKIPPSKEVQSQIGNILSAYDDLIENNLRRIKLLEELAQRTYEEWFVKGIINKGFISESNVELISLRSMIKEYMNGGWGKDEKEGSYSEKAFVLRGTDMPEISTGIFSKLPLRFHTKSNLTPRVLKAGDISIEMSNGNINSIGRSFFYDGSLDTVLRHPMMCASFCKMLRPLNLDFAYIIDLHLKYIHGNKSMLIYKSQGANGINNFRFEGMISEEILRVPTGKYLNKFIEPIKRLYRTISNLRIQISYLKESRDILLPRLMNGTINVEAAKEQMMMAAEDEVKFTSNL